RQTRAHNDCAGSGQASRTLDATAGSACKSERPRRIYPYHAATRHADREDLPEHGVPRAHQIDRRHRRTRTAWRVRGLHRRARPPSDPGPLLCPAFHDQPILALNKVHYIGEPVAVVLAADPHAADQAVQLIAADYQELPAVFDEIEAADDKVLVHEE